MLNNKRFGGAMELAFSYSDDGDTKQKAIRKSAEEMGEHLGLSEKQVLELREEMKGEW